MWKFSLLSLLFFTITVSHSILLNFLSLEFLKVDLAIPFIVYSVFFDTPIFALFVAVTFALIQEGLTSCIGGTLLFSKSSVFLFAFFLRSRLYIESHYTFAALCGITEVFECIVVLGLSVFTEGKIQGVPNILINLFPVATFTAIFSIPIYFLILRLDRKYRETRWE
ncbi:MAG: hypothetical protein NZ583_07420 [Desulfobacterota bacterium]|nr:hypothetical protein [Thermodesulfobacteriota bacterium]MDW8002808.1 hypothetical protein [Deltaproteobacteria bacterium]